MEVAVLPQSALGPTVSLWPPPKCSVGGVTRRPDTLRFASEISMPQAAKIAWTSGFSRIDLAKERERKMNELRYKSKRVYVHLLQKTTFRVIRYKE